MQKRKCDKCDQPATYHAVEIVSSQKVEKHLCDIHAAEEGLTFKAAPKPINELLTNFVKMHSGNTPKQEMTCEHCGLTFAQFQQRSLLGCPGCYEAFGQSMAQLLSRAHEGSEQHHGKVPQRAGTGQVQQHQLLRMRKRLDEAVDAEDYELAAHLRDEINHMSEGAPS